MGHAVARSHAGQDDAPKPVNLHRIWVGWLYRVSLLSHDDVKGRNLDVENISLRHCWFILVNPSYFPEAAVSRLFANESDESIIRRLGPWLGPLGQGHRRLNGASKLLSKTLPTEV